MRKYRVYQVDAFTKTRFAGNPAGVVPDADGLGEREMLSIARELNNSETSFVFSPTAPDHDVWVRFFTPKTEVPICGHATIAAHYVWALEQKLSAVTVVQKTGAGLLPVEIVPQGDDYRIIMTQGAIKFSEPFAVERQAEILSALGLAEGDMEKRCPVQIVSTGHSKVLIGIRSRQTLNALQPDLTRLSALSREIRCNGYFVFTLDSGDENIFAHGRMFAPAIGIAEDPVTGNANGPLGAYLVHHRLVPAPPNGVFSFKARQGEAMGRPGEMEVYVETGNGGPRNVRVAGHAVVAFQTEIEL